MRKPISQVKQRGSSNLDDRDAIIALLLKRMCTFEGTVDYLLSFIREMDKDDMIGELLAWDAKIRELRRIQDKNSK